MTRTRVLFYCQHSLGLGHLARSLAIVEELVRDCDVVFLNGGRFPAGRIAPEGCEVVNLPPLGHDEGYELVSHDDRFTVAAACGARRDLVLAALDRVAPDVIIVELYPFGRKKFEFELGPLLRANRDRGAQRARVLCSLRDILVSQRRDQQRHDDRAAALAEEFFDLVAVHSDPTFARIEESFRPARPLSVPVAYTGFVAPDAPIMGPNAERLRRVIVSVGGGSVGAPLIAAAIAAAPRIAAEIGLSTLVVAGPFLPELDWKRLVAAAHGSCVLEARRHVDDLCAEVAMSAVSVSQCGYNTTMDLLRARTPAVVVPYSEGKEDEQRRRAERLADLGVLRVVAPDRLDGAALRDAVGAALASPPATTALSLDGRAATGRLVGMLAASSANGALTTLTGVAR